MYEYQVREDPPRPADFPYQAGHSFSIRRHRAPPPFGKRYTIAPGLRQHTNFDFPDYPMHPCYRKPEESLHTLSNLERCLLYPPQERPHFDFDDEDVEDEGEVEKDKQDYEKEWKIHITEEVVARVGHGAQILRCRIEADQAEIGKSFFVDKNDYVAKVYDGVYYNNMDGWYGDVAFCADHEYSVEVAAYEHLRYEGVNGQYSPMYFGSFTFDVPVVSDNPEHPKTRPVRMIMIEYIRGKDMFSLLKDGVVDTIPVPRRLELVAEAMEKLSMLEFHGLCHNDFEPRNILVLDSVMPEVVGPDKAGKEGDIEGDDGDDGEKESVVIIDFGHSFVVDSYWLLEKYLMERQDKPRSPMYRFWGKPPDTFAAWIPHVYHRRRPAFNGWLKHRWGSMAADEDKYHVPNESDRRWGRFDDETEFIPPESIPLVEERITGPIVLTLDPEYEKEIRASWN